MSHQIHPNDKQAQIRVMRRNLRRAQNYQRSTQVLDAMAKGALEAAREHITKLEVDTERLDWLDKNPNRVGHAQGYRGSSSAWSYRAVAGGEHRDAASLRGAIDGARGVNVPVNSEGCYFAPDGTFMNADGTRSIFDDIDQ